MRKDAEHVLSKVDVFLPGLTFPGRARLWGKGSEGRNKLDCIREIRALRLQSCPLINHRCGGQCKKLQADGKKMAKDAEDAEAAAKQTANLLREVHIHIHVHV